MTIAALYVQAGGTYASLLEIDLWPEARDARRYGGPHRVVAHPPCGPWGFAARRWRRLALGQDAGCFNAAIVAVRRWGGILEHPAGSSAFRHFELTRPGGWGWTPVRDAEGRHVITEGGAHWVCSVDQGHFGHPAPKRTWLYLVSREWVATLPPSLPWGPSGATGRVLAMPDVLDREATPGPFAELLIALAEGRDIGAVGPSAEASGLVTAPRCPIDGRPVAQSGRGPKRIFCSVACRQRASRQRRAGGTVEGESDDR